MKVKKLIQLLKQCPQDLPVSFEGRDIVYIEISETGESGYEVCGEIRLIS